MSAPTITLIGGPTVLIEAGGFRLLTDPTFDAPGEYRLPHVVLQKTAGPSIPARAVGSIDAVLLSHDQHADNLDDSGRAFLTGAGKVFTTVAGARRLRGNSDGLAPWDTRELTAPDGRRMRITATPARHGPAGIEPLSGDVIGFVLAFADDQRPGLHHRRHGLVRRRGRGGAPLRRRHRAGICRRGQDARPVSPHHGRERRHRDGACLSGRLDRPGALRRLGPFHAKSQRHGASFETLGLASRLRLLEPGVATPMRP